jgi:lysine 2,3-aminomutase
MLIDAGIQLGNQSVLLKRVNDSPETFKELNQKLLSIGVKPYYLYQPDPVKGTFHFIGPVKKGLEIIEKGLRGHTTGMAVPQFVIDAPGGGGKIPLLPNYAKIKKNGSVKLRNYQNKKFKYPSIN